MRRSESGSAILPLLGLSAVTILLLVPFLDLIGVAKHQASILSQRAMYRALLDSAVDYTIYGLRQRWCFSTSWQPDGNCHMAHSRSSERILFNDASLAAFQSLLSENPDTPHGNPLVLESIQHTLDLQTLTPAHPLYRLAVSAKGAFQSIRFEIRRVNNVNVPTRGRETTLTVKAILQSSAAIFKGLSSISQTSTILASPRELSRFALIVPRDLRLDASVSASSVGDANFVNFASQSTAGNGLIFESPVFVNRNIHLPSPQSPGFTPVSFAGRVQMGNGQILQGGNYLAPSSAGGFGSQFFNELPGFGGFLGGVDSDSVQDEGLNALISSTDASPSTSQLQTCVNHNLNLTVLERTMQSSLLIKRNLSIPGGYRLGLSKGNMFMLQDDLGGKPTIKKAETTEGEGEEEVEVEDFFPSEPVLVGSGKKAIRVLVRFQQNGTPGAGVEANMPRDATLIIPIPSKSKTPGQTIEITTSSFVNHEKTQNHLLNIQVRTPHGISLLKNDAFVNIRIKAYDVAVSGRDDLRTLTPLALGPPAPDPQPTLDPNYSRVVTLVLQKTAFSSSLVETVSVGSTWRVLDANLTSPGPPLELPDENFDYASLHDQCATSLNGGWLAFQPVDWGTSFTSGTRVSWNFARPTETTDGYKTYPSNGEILLNSATSGDFQIASINGICRIAASANRVFGFLVCDHLIIEPRSNPLLIIGTIIAGRTTIDSSALINGIRWRSIYHPQSVVDLRQAEVLKPLPASGTLCQNIPGIPFWSPTAGVTELANQRLCSPLHLRDSADPFTWTTVDPDCGLPASDSTAIQCKRRPLRFLIKEVSRVSDV